MSFAKLFEKDDKQILVKMDQDSENYNPEIRFYFEPDGLGVCSVAISYKDDGDKSWNKCEKTFNAINEDTAVKVAKKAMDATGQDFPW